MLPPAPPRQALLLGLGGGTLAHLLATRWRAEPRIVGVEHDPGVLALAASQGWHDVPGLEVVQADAFEYLFACQERFDYLALDLFQGGRFVGRSLSRPVLQRVRAVLDSPGWVALNLFRDARAPARVARVGRVLRVAATVEVGSNLVVHARAR